MTKIRYRILKITPTYINQYQDGLHLTQFPLKPLSSVEKKCYCTNSELSLQWSKTNSRKINEDFKKAFDIQTHQKKSKLGHCITTKYMCLHHFMNVFYKQCRHLQLNFLHKVKFFSEVGIHSLWNLFSEIFIFHYIHVYIYRRCQNQNKGF